MDLISVPTLQETPENELCVVSIKFGSEERRTFLYRNRHDVLDEYVQAGKLSLEQKDLYIRMIERARSSTPARCQTEQSVAEALARTIAFGNPSLELPDQGLSNSIRY